MRAIERFWSRVAIGDAAACWPWTRGAIRQGYGQLAHEGRVVLAHRLSWEISHGPVPEGLCVLHRCDNPPCCNPAHLFLGTNADNMADMAGKDRSAFGERNADARMSALEVACARALSRAGASQRSLAVVFGVSHTAMRRALLARTWRRVEAEPCEPRGDVTHCPRGHEYTDENTFRWGPRGSFRKCRACRRDLKREQNAAATAGLSLHEYRHLTRREGLL